VHRAAQLLIDTPRRVDERKRDARHKAAEAKAEEQRMAAAIPVTVVPQRSRARVASNKKHKTPTRLVRSLVGVR
jgi:hypothetical protein